MLRDENPLEFVMIRELANAVCSFSDATWLVVRRALASTFPVIRTAAKLLDLLKVYLNMFRIRAHIHDPVSHDSVEDLDIPGKAPRSVPYVFTSASVCLLLRRSSTPLGLLQIQSALMIKGWRTYN